MSSLVLLLFAFTLLTIATEVLGESFCRYSMHCNDKVESDKSCMRVTPTESRDIYKIWLNRCSSQRASYCNVYDGLLQLSNYSSECLKRPDQLLSYPGGKCARDADCRYGLCLDGICKDSDVRKKCYSDESCPIGTACFMDDIKEKLCMPLKKVNEPCAKSTECQINLTCANKKCIKKYSFKNEEIITSFKGNVDEKLDNLCESGLAVEYEQEVICASVINAHNFEDKCLEDCEYKMKDIVIKVPFSCRCGYNSQRAKYCILGSGEPDYVRFMKEKRQLINDDAYQKYCHTLERNSDNYCIEKLKTERSIAFRQAVQDYNNLKISVLEHHRLINAKDCVKTVVFDYNTLPVLPDKRKCATFSCNDTLSTCALGNNPLNEEGDGVKIHLNDKLCNDPSVCLMSSETGINFIYENNTVMGACGEKPYKEKKRLPGEDCTHLLDCFNSTCGADNKCEGKSLNESCSSHAECKVGLYCSSSGCQKQRKEGESCETSWDCQNYLGCYSIPGSNSICMIFGQVSDIDITLLRAKWQGEPKYHTTYDPIEIGTNLMCKSGQTSVNQKRCGLYSYDTSKPSMTKENNQNLIECQADDECHYIDNYKATTSKKCECGYNADGKGYCPLPNGININDWERLNKLKSDLTDNQCHTLSRFDCYLNPSTKLIKDLERATVQAHLFYDAVPCAYKVLNSNWIGLRWLNMLLISFILALF